MVGVVSFEENLIFLLCIYQHYYINDKSQNRSEAAAIRVSAIYAKVDTLAKSIDPPELVSEFLHY